jgi:hypothetical protein
MGFIDRLRAADRVCSTRFKVIEYIPYIHYRSDMDNEELEFYLRGCLPYSEQLEIWDNITKQDRFS